jgi:hypothetical protein
MVKGNVRKKNEIGEVIKKCGRERVRGGNCLEAKRENRELI